MNIIRNRRSGITHVEKGDVRLLCGIRHKFSDYVEAPVTCKHCHRAIKKEIIKLLEALGQ